MRPIYATNLIYTFMDLSPYSHQVFYLLLFYISFYISRWGSYHFSQIFGTKIGRKIFIVMLKLNILHLSLMILEQIVKKKRLYVGIWKNSKIQFEKKIFAIHFVIA